MKTIFMRASSLALAFLLVLGLAIPTASAAVFTDVQTEEPITTRTRVFDGSTEVVFDKVPLFNQGDYPNSPYGREEWSVASHGCGITSVAMVATYLTNEMHAPDVLAVQFGRYNTVHGSYWSLFGDSAEVLGLGKVTQTSNWSKVTEALKNGQPVVSIQSTGLFTGGGHFIVLTGMTEDGKVLVNDPNGGNWHKNAVMIEGFANGFTPAQIRASGGTYWIYQPKDEVLALRADMNNNN